MIPQLADRLTCVSLNAGRLDYALRKTPMVHAVVFRQRLNAIRRQSAVNGCVVDPWHLVAELYALPRRILGENGFDRGNVVDAAAHAFELWRWNVRPDPGQRDLIAQATEVLNERSSDLGPFLSSGQAVHRWLQDGKPRAPIWAALSRYWQAKDVFRTSLMLTGAQSLAPGTPWEVDQWLPCWLDALSIEIEETHDLLRQLERARSQALERCGAQRRHSRAPQAINVLAVQPLVSASMLANCLGMSMKSALQLLGRFQERGLVVEVTHRAAHRLFSLVGMTALRDAVHPPRRPLPGRKQGRPRKNSVSLEACLPEEEILQMPPPIRLSAVQFDYEGLAAAMRQADEAMLGSSRLIARLNGKRDG